MIVSLLERLTPEQRQIIEAYKESILNKKINSEYKNNIINNAVSELSDKKEGKK